MQVKKGFLLKQVCGQSFLIPIGEANIDLSKLIALNETSLFMWQRMVKGNFTVDDIVEDILKEYDATEEEIRPDVEAIIEQFKQEGLIEE